jgi:DNA-binding NtrC family response regulator
VWERLRLRNLLKKGQKMDALAKLANLKILLVDDDPFIRDAMTLAFRQKKFSLVTAETAEEGLKAMHEETFNIIISDFKLPGNNGLTFLKQAIASQPGSIKLLISASGNDEVVSEAYRIGVHDFLQKPFTLETLLATLLMHLDKVEEQKSSIIANTIMPTPLNSGV